MREPREDAQIEWKWIAIVLTVPPVEFGEAWRVTAGQLGGAPEGCWRQIGHQRAVTLLCQPITKQKKK